MKKVILGCLLLSLSVSYLKAQNRDSIVKDNYWVTETGSCSNPYTIIRLYTYNDTHFGEIALKCKRLNIKRRTIKRLNYLAANFKSALTDKVKIASLLNVKPEAIDYIKNEL